jgi:hypothetical protein
MRVPDITASVFKKSFEPPEAVKEAIVGAAGV